MSVQLRIIFIFLNHCYFSDQLNLIKKAFEIKCCFFCCLTEYLKTQPHLCLMYMSILMARSTTSALSEWLANAGCTSTPSSLTSRTALSPSTPTPTKVRPHIDRKINGCSGMHASSASCYPHRVWTARPLR